MKSASAGLIALLNSSEQAYIADLYTFTLNDGTLLKYTDADRDIGAFLSSDIQLSRDGIRIVKGVEVDTMSVTVYYPPTSTFMRSLQKGALDGARMTIERAIMATWGDISNGTVIMFSGRVANADFDRTMATITIKSDFELMNIKMPKNLYQPSCSHSLYSAGCGVNKATHTKTYSIISASTSLTFNTNVAEASGVYDQGVILFTSGQNAGVKRTVKAQNAAVIGVSLPLVYPVQVGDTFEISKGCDKTKATCQTKFNNLNNFRGFPFIPRPETAR